jgi:hypothetical protein
MAEQLNSEQNHVDPQVELLANTRFLGVASWIFSMIVSVTLLVEAWMLFYVTPGIAIFEDFDVEVPLFLIWSWRARNYVAAAFAVLAVAVIAKEMIAKDVQRRLVATLVALSLCVLGLAFIYILCWLPWTVLQGAVA